MNGKQCHVNCRNDLIQIAFLWGNIQYESTNYGFCKVDLASIVCDNNNQHYSVITLSISYLLTTLSLRPRLQCSWDTLLTVSSSEEDWHTQKKKHTQRTHTADENDSYVGWLHDTATHTRTHPQSIYRKAPNQAISQGLHSLNTHSKWQHMQYLKTIVQSWFLHF